MVRLSSIVLVLVCLFATSPARGDETKAEALYSGGATLYGQGRYAEAAAAFAEAYEAAPLPKYLYNQAQAMRLAGNCEGAVHAYRRFLRLDVPDDQRAHAADNVAACEAQLGRPVPPEPEPVPPPPASTAPIAPTPAPVGTSLVQPLLPPAVPPEATPVMADPLGATLLATGIVTAGLGAGLLAWSFVDEAALEEGETTYGDHVDRLERAEATRTAGAVLLGAGGALLAGSVIRYVVVASDRVDVAAAPAGIKMTVLY